MGAGKMTVDPKYLARIGGRWGANLLADEVVRLEAQVAALRADALVAKAAADADRQKAAALSEVLREADLVVEMVHRGEVGERCRVLAAGYLHTRALMGDDDAEP